MKDIEGKVSDYFESQQAKINQNDIEKAASLVDKIQEIVRKSEILNREFAKVKLLGMMVKDFVDDVYSEVPKRTIAAIVITLLYIVNPVDIIPDFIPVVGFIDDVLMLTLAWKLVSDDVKEYAKWKISKDKDGEIKRLYKEAFGE